MNRRLIAVASVVLAAAAFSLSLPSLAAACSCMQVPQPNAFADATSVFEGRVTSNAELGGNRQVVLTVVRTWKGANVQEITISTASNSAACGYNFELDSSYLVYTHGELGTESVSLCGRTVLVEQGAEDIAAMGEGVTPVDPQPPEEEVVQSPVQAEPQEVPPGQGGCAGCEITDPSAPLSALSWAGLMVVGLLRRRR